MRRIVASAFLLVLAFASAHAQAPAQPAGPPLWRVEHEGRVLWVLGTLSPVERDAPVMPPHVARAISASSELVLPPQVVFTTRAGMFDDGLLLPEMLDARRGPDDSRLEDVVPGALYQRWEDAKRRHIGRDGGVEKLRPVFAALALYEEARDEAGLRAGIVEEAVLEQAGDARLRLTRTEVGIAVGDAEATLEALRGTREADLQCFRLAVDRIDADVAAMQRRSQAWAAGDIATLQSLGLDDQERACRESVTRPPLLRERSGRDFEAEARDRWLDAVDAALAGNTSSFAMVPLHLLFGDAGYLAALAARGYAIVGPDSAVR